MTYEYRIEFLPVPQLSQESEASPAPPNLVYACGETGECQVRDMRMEQIEHVRDFLNEMGADRWELVQIFFHRTGAVTFWKRAIPDDDDRKS
jgi:hypothetical protein